MILILKYIFFSNTHTDCKLNWTPYEEMKSRQKKNPDDDEEAEKEEELQVCYGYLTKSSN